MRKFKLAICVSGQSRSHNQIADQWYADIEEIFGDFDYDFFGHTWDDQELPNTDKFKGFKTDDQSMIDKFVSKDLMSLAYNNPGWANNDDWNNLLDNGGARQHLLDASRAAYGQYVSAYMCWEVAAPYADNYDAVIRYRWDTGIRRDEHEAWREKVELVKTAILNFCICQNMSMEEIVELEQNEEIVVPNLIAYSRDMCNTMVGYPSVLDGDGILYIPDHMFVLHSSVLTNVKGRFWAEVLKGAIKKSYPNKPAAHTGWVPFLKGINAELVTGMPEIHTCIHIRHDGDKDFQHKWGI